MLPPGKLIRRYVMFKLVDHTTWHLTEWETFVHNDQKNVTEKKYVEIDRVTG
jgi:hypothetical protein